MVYMFGPKSKNGNDQIEFWEAIIMLCMYFGYVFMMKFNNELQAAFAAKFSKKTSVAPEDAAEGGAGVTKDDAIDDDAPKRAGVTKDDAVDDDAPMRHWTGFRIGILDIIMKSKP